MNFRELPKNQQLLFIAHSLTAIAALLATFANILALTERGALPNETAKPPPSSDGKVRGYFDT